MPPKAAALLISRIILVTSFTFGTTDLQTDFKTLYLSTKDKFVVVLKFTEEDIKCQSVRYRAVPIGEYASVIQNELAVKIMKECTALTSGGGHERRKRSSRHRRFIKLLKSIFMMPGTKWCGWGNTASHSGQLGKYNWTDACCRDHDTKCKVQLGGWSKGFGLRNLAPITRSSCTCDERFYRCLKNAEKHEAKTARLTGKTYFNILDLDCIAVIGKRKKCLKRSFLGLFCKRYEKTATLLKYGFRPNNRVF